MKEFKRYDVDKLRDMICGLGQYTDLSISRRERCKIHICEKYNNDCRTCMFYYGNNVNALDCNDTLGLFTATPTIVMMKRLKDILGQSEIKGYKRFKSGVRK